MLMEFVSGPDYVQYTLKKAFEDNWISGQYSGQYREVEGSTMEHAPSDSRASRRSAISVADHSRHKLSRSIPAPEKSAAGRNDVIV